MNRVFAALLLLAVLFPARSASQSRPADAPRLIDSFGDIWTSDLKARLDNFAIDLDNSPAARGFVVFHGAKHKFPGWPARRARYCVSYLTNTRGLDASRLSVMNGGLRDDTLLELWFVPPGAELSAKPFDVSLLMSGEKTPLPFDRFNVIERGDASESEDGDDYPDDADLYEYFAEALRRDPGLRGVVIGYTSRRGPPAAGRRIAALAKMTIAKSHAVEIRRVVAVGGGRRDFKTIELWLAPPGAELPKPTPDARRTRRRRR